MSDSALIRYRPDDFREMAKAVVASGMFPGIRNEAQAMTLFMLADANNMHPMKAALMYDVLPSGKPSMKGEAMLAEFQARGGTVKWLRRDATACVGIFTSPGVPDGMECSFTIEDAKIAQLTGKDNWKKYAPDMLQWRCVTRGVKATLPAAGLGLYPTEVARDFEENEAPQVVKTDVEILANPSLDVEEKPLAQVLDEAKVKSLGAVETYAPESVERTDRIALTEAQQRIAAREEAVAAVDKSLPLKEQLVQIEEHVRAKVAKEKRDACKLCGSPLGDYTSHAGVEYRQCIKAHGDWEAARKMGIEGMGLKAISKGHTWEKQKVAQISDELNQAMAE